MTLTLRYLMLLVIGSLFTTAAVAVGQSSGADASRTASGAICARAGLDENGRMQISPDDRCPVCAMRPAKYPEFSSAIVLADGCACYFCSSGCMLRTWMEPERFLHTPRANLKRCIVRNYFSGEQFDGETAIWIAGSDVIGPMGPAPVPVKTEDEAATFKRRHGAGRVFRLPQLDLETWKTISSHMLPP